MHRGLFLNAKCNVGIRKLEGRSSIVPPNGTYYFCNNNYTFLWEIFRRSLFLCCNIVDRYFLGSIIYFYIIYKKCWYLFQFISSGHYWIRNSNYVFDEVFSTNGLHFVSFIILFGMQTFWYKKHLHANICVSFKWTFRENELRIPGSIYLWLIEWLVTNSTRTYYL